MTRQTGIEYRWIIMYIARRLQERVDLIDRKTHLQEPVQLVGIYGVVATRKHSDRLEKTVLFQY